MKIRSGYVSNSSSSSFVVIGKDVGNIYSNNLQLDFENKQYVMLGKELSDGTDYIELTAELFEWIDKRKFDLDWGNGSIIEIITSGKNAWSADCIKIPDNLSNAFAWSIKADDWSSSSIEDLEKRYIRK
jgi:hypothetical protein